MYQNPRDVSEQEQEEEEQEEKKKRKMRKKRKRRKRRITFLANQVPLACVTHSLEWMPVSIQTAGRPVPPVLNYRTSSPVRTEHGERQGEPEGRGVGFQGLQGLQRLEVVDHDLVVHVQALQVDLEGLQAVEGNPDVHGGLHVRHPPPEVQLEGRRV
ncbi:hypothetical protein EYF80_058467 [Liparis tanakae]|uniref:Uncharacterized protein n=1 Tax=Liparis tanakae TaxID=230148 RepID=A0A4Z2ES18_9TELE|nr:hypothetical protein EYF80_058467 [Liparis tanakae]